MCLLYICMFSWRNVYQYPLHILIIYSFINCNNYFTYSYTHPLSCNL
uniref:Macaca fascicularis brain cDNA clone: QtrA-15078, similar to human MARVEL (membrane-associating) domain containing 2(MRVLDC2), mRNA, RefSeq: NM_144724.1 n=1 Tax=Macaca fascicularis TaxID=9541 RepID=I7GJ82_MACFA|nr:unnamed protein product [Macaca fascicularis]